MCEYDMDPASIVEDTEWTWFSQMAGQGGASIPHFNFSPFNFVEAGSMKILTFS